MSKEYYFHELWFVPHTESIVEAAVIEELIRDVCKDLEVAYSCERNTLSDDSQVLKCMLKVSSDIPKIDLEKDLQDLFNEEDLEIEVNDTPTAIRVVTVGKMNSLDQLRSALG